MKPSSITKLVETPPNVSTLILLVTNGRETFVIGLVTLLLHTSIGTTPVTKHAPIHSILSQQVPNISAASSVMKIKHYTLITHVQIIVLFHINTETNGIVISVIIPALEVGTFTGMVLVFLAVTILS